MSAAHPDECTLDKKVDPHALLAMAREEMIDTVIGSFNDSNPARGASIAHLNDESYRYLIARNSDREGVFLIWDGPGENTDLTEDVYIACSEEAQREKLKPVYHVYARYNLFQTENVRFCQIPDRILMDFGLDVRGDAYTESE